MDDRVVDLKEITKSMQIFRLMKLVMHATHTLKPMIIMMTAVGVLAWKSVLDCILVEVNWLDIMLVILLVVQVCRAMCITRYVSMFKWLMLMLICGSIVPSGDVIYLWLFVADDTLIVVGFVGGVQGQMGLSTQILVTVVFFLVTILVEVLQVMVVTIMDVASDLVFFFWVRHRCNVVIQTVLSFSCNMVSVSLIMIFVWLQHLVLAMVLLMMCGRSFLGRRNRLNNGGWLRWCSLSSRRRGGSLLRRRGSSLLWCDRLCRHCRLLTESVRNKLILRHRVVFHGTFSMIGILREISVT